MRTSIVLARRLGAIGLVALAAGACDVQNPAEITPETSNPEHLVRGAFFQLEASYPVIATAVFLASDEGMSNSATSTDALVHDNADATYYPFFERTFRDMHHARDLADAAVTRSEERNDPRMLRQAHVARGWIYLRLAELWGAQPFGDGVLHQPAEILDTATAGFEAVVAALPNAVDSASRRLSLEARAGIARIEWHRGRAPVDVQRLTRARDLALGVLAEDPAFVYEPIPPRATHLSGFGSSRRPEPSFQYVPNPIPQPATRNRMVRLIDADELRLIAAEAEVRLGNLDAAKTLVKATGIMPINTVGVGRAPGPRTRPPMTSTEIAAAIDPMNEAALLFAIEELRRESQFGLGRRAVGPNGEAVLPIALPGGA